MKKITIIGMIVAVAMMFGCGTQSDVRSSAKINGEVTANPMTVSPGATSQITCDAQGSISWTATAGTISGSGKSVLWTAPTTTGSYVITATASDSEGSVSKSVTVTVVDVIVPPTLWTLAGANMYSLASDTAGNIIVTGTTNTNLFATNQGGKDAFLAKFNASDSKNAWGIQRGSAANDGVDRGGNYVAVLNNGKIYWQYELGQWPNVSAVMMAILNSDGTGTTISSPGNFYATDGEYLYGASSNPSGGNSLLAKADQSGTIISAFAVSFDRLAAFGGYIYTTGDSGNGAVTIKYDANSGSEIWNQTWASGPSAKIITADASGIYVFTENDQPLLHGGSVVYYMLKYDSAGNLVRSRSDLTDQAWSVVADVNYLYAVGNAGLVKFNKTDLSTVWSQPAGAGYSLVLVNGVIYVANGGDTLLRFDSVTGNQLL